MLILQSLSYFEKQGNSSIQPFWSDNPIVLGLQTQCIWRIVAYKYTCVFSYIHHQLRDA